MGVQLVHGLAESLVRVVGRLNPCAIGVRVADEFAEVDDTAEHVTEPVQVLDDLEELLPGLLRAKNAVREDMSAYECPLSDRVERAGVREHGVVEEARCREAG